MKWVAMLFWVINGAVYLWVGGGHATVDPSTTIQPDVNPQGLLLLHERWGKDQADESFEDHFNLIVTKGHLSPAARAITNEEQLATPPNGLCYRIGPFQNDRDRHSAIQSIESQKWAYRELVGTDREIRVIDVTLGPFDSKKHMSNVVYQLQQEGFAYLRVPSEAKADKTLLSLGFFTQKNLAMTFAEDLSVRDANLQMQTEYRAMEALSWVELTVDAQQRPQVLGWHWPGEKVTAWEINCR